MPLAEDTQSFIQTLTNDKTNFIIDKASKLFDKYFDEQKKVIKFDVKKNPKYYQRTKEIFISIIIDFFRKHKILISERPNLNTSILGKLIKYTTLTNKNIEKIIESFLDAAMIFSINFLKSFTHEVELKIQEMEQKHKKELNIYRNRKGKDWRDELYKLAKKEYESNSYIDKTKALKIAFEKLSDKEKHRKDFDLHFKSIYETFRKK